MILANKGRGGGERGEGRGDDILQKHCPVLTRHCGGMTNHVTRADSNPIWQRRLGSESEETSLALRVEVLISFTNQISFHSLLFLFCFCILFLFVCYFVFLYIILNYY